MIIVEVKITNGEKVEITSNEMPVLLKVPENEIDLFAARYLKEYFDVSLDSTGLDVESIEVIAK